MKGILTTTLDWLTHASNADTQPIDWAAGLVLILILSFLWYTVVQKQLE